jgi:hypothetical protein
MPCSVKKLSLTSNSMSTSALPMPKTWYFFIIACLRVDLLMRNHTGLHLREESGVPLHCMRDTGKGLQMLQFAV